MILLSPLTPIEDVLRHILDWFHGTVGLPWSWSIVALTIMVRLLLVPLTVRQIHSMQNLQRHAPQMKEIQKKYKNDKKRQQEELMKFYRENQINPAASCLPLLAQFPVFIALYFVLRQFARHPPGGDLSWLGHSFVPDITAHANAALVGLRLARRLRGEPARVDDADVEHDGQDAADHADGPADRLRHVPAQVPGGPRHLLGDHEPVDGRAGAHHQAADAEAPGAGAPLLAHAAEGEPARGGSCRARRARAGSRGRRATP